MFSNCPKKTIIILIFVFRCRWFQFWKKKRKQKSYSIVLCTIPIEFHQWKIKTVFIWIIKISITVLHHKQVKNFIKTSITYRTVESVAGWYITSRSLQFRQMKFSIEIWLGIITDVLTTSTRTASYPIQVHNRKQKTKTFFSIFTEYENYCPTVCFL